MQEIDWDDLKYVLAVARGGALIEAARILGVNETTVARRVRALETKVGAPLFLAGNGPTRHLTETGSAVIKAAQQVERACLSMSDEIGLVRHQLSGIVRITSVPMIVNRVLAPHLPAFFQRHPNVSVELVPDARNLNLTQREADLAVRLGRPQTGGMNVKARKLGTLQYAVYGLPKGSAQWITYDETQGHLPQARWLAAQSKAHQSRVRVCDVETAYQAVAAGLGRTLLPALIGDSISQLEQLSGYENLPTREVWLVSHAEPEATRAVTAAKTWLDELDWSGRFQEDTQAR